MNKVVIIADKRYRVCITNCLNKFSIWNSCEEALRWGKTWAQLQNDLAYRKR